MESVKKEEPASALTEIRVENSVLLKLQGESFKVNKIKLSKESLYFNSLFSGNFCDSNKNEFNIEYEVDLEIFKTFVDWLEYDENLADDIWGHYYKKSLSKYVHGCYKELLELFRFASFYAVENLLDSLSYIIVDNWSQPENLIEIWLMAEERRENLKKAMFAMCLDLFELLPQDSLLRLPKSNFELLVKNVNLICTEAYRQSILNEWIKRNKEKEEGKQEETKNKIKKNIQNHKPSRDLHCVTGFKKNVRDEEATVFFWDGTKLEELVKLVDNYKTYTQAGTQILGRGYSIYIVGGEKIVGHGTFNLYIWRYCLLTLKLYRVERLLDERRHMVAAFLGNKLILVGGVGKYRVKLTSVHIFDIRTRIWTKGADVPLSFTDVPPSCVIGNKLLIATSGIYSYDLQTKTWNVLMSCNDTKLIKNIVHHNNKLYAAVQTHCDEPIKVKLYMLERKDEISDDFTFVFQGEIIVGLSYNLMTIDNCFVWFIIKDGKIVVEVGHLESECYKSLLSYCEERDDKIFFKSNEGIFSLLNPAALFLQRDDETSS